MSYISHACTFGNGVNNTLVFPRHSLPTMASPVDPRGMESIFARLVVVIGTTFALHVCMRKPNPDPSVDNRKQAWGLENAARDLLRPFTVVSCFPTELVHV